MSNKRKCLMCETEYKYCPYCRDYDQQPRWKTTFDKEECRNVYNILTGYYSGNYTKDVAREKLLNVNIDGIIFNNAVKKQIDEVLQVSTEELKTVHDEITDSDEVMDGIKNIEPVLKNDKVFEKADEKKKQAVKIKPVSTVKPVVNKATNK